MSGLDWQNFDVKFTEGLDTKTQPKLVIPSKWRQLQNMTLSQDRTPRRRYGQTPLIASQDGNSLALYNDELLTVNNISVGSVVDPSGTPTAYTRDGRKQWFDVQKAPVSSGNVFCDMQDCATSGTLTAYVWREKTTGNVVTGVYCTIVDETTGAIVLSHSTLRAATTVMCPRVVYADGAFFIFYLDTATTIIYGRVIVASAPTSVGSETNIVLAVAAPQPQNFDACANGNQVAVASVINSGGISVRTDFVTRSGTTPSTTGVNTVTAANIAVADVDGITVASFDGTLVGVFIVHQGAGAIADGLAGVTVNSSAGVVTAVAALDATVPPVGTATHVTAGMGASGMTIYTDQISSYGTANFRPIRCVTVSSTLVVGFATTVGNSSCFDVNAARASGPQGPFICGKPIFYSSLAFLPVCIMENYSAVGANTATFSAQCSFWLMHASPAFTAPQYMVAGALLGTYGVPLDGGSGAGTIAVAQPCSTPSLATGIFRIGLPEFGDLQIRNINNLTPIGISSLKLTAHDVADYKPASAEQLQQSCFFAGGGLDSYDGAAVREHGFRLYPEGVSVVVTATGTGSVTAGAHQLVAVYEWFDNSGQRHQSAPSPAVSFTVANATDRIDVIIPSLLLTQRTDVAIALYMTLASGTTFYRLYPSYTSIANTTSASTVSVNTGTFVVTDAVLATCELLYSQPSQAGATLPNIYAGPCSAVAVAQNRLWYDKADQPLKFGYSQESLANTGLRFSDELEFELPPESGGPVAFRALDEKVIILGRRKPYVIYGTGPTPSGGFNNYSDPQEIPSDVGCEEPFSVIKTPMGIVFKSPKGWYLLGRDLSVRYIGDAVAEFDDDGHVTSAVMLGDRHECRFTLASGTILVWDYGEDQWSTFVVASYTPSCAAWWPAFEKYMHISLSDGLNYESTTTYLDSIVSTAVPSTIAQTSWLKVSSISGFQRVRWLYLTGTAWDGGGSPETTLNIAVAYDDSTSVTDAYNFNVDLSLLSFAAGQTVDLRHKLTRMKCKSVSFTFTESGSGVPLQGFQGMTLNVGTKRGQNKLPATQTVT